MDRRQFFAAAGIAGSAAAVTLATPAQAMAAVTLPVVPVTLVGRAADALSVVGASGWAATIRTLAAHQGKLYYGYGDYGVNSGSKFGTGTNVSFWNPATNAFGCALSPFRAEQIMAYRKIEGRLYAANVDPSGGASGNAVYASDDGAVNGKPGVWGLPAGSAGVEHAFDVCGGVAPGERFLCGSTGGSTPGAVIWRSTNYGATWSVFFREPEVATKVDGYERFYWLGRIGNFLYCRANLGPQRKAVAPMRKYDLVGKSWSTVSDRNLTLGGDIAFAGGWSGPNVLGDTQTTDSGQVWSHGSYIYFQTSTGLRAFDGAKMYPVLAAGGYVENVRGLSIGDDGHLYGHGSSLIYRVNALVATPVVKFGTLGLDAAGHAGLGAISVGVLGGKAYIGAAEGNIFSVPLPA